MFHLLHQLDVNGNTRSRIYVDDHAFNCTSLSILYTHKSNHCQTSVTPLC
jgi:hypothetical protein